MSVKLRIGALCRLDDGAPARYVGHGVGLSITLTGQRFGVAHPPTGGEYGHPLPTDREVFSRTQASDEELGELLSPHASSGEPAKTADWESLKGLKY